jgi:hypothetical protein
VLPLPSPTLLEEVLAGIAACDSRSFFSGLRRCFRAEVRFSHSFDDMSGTRFPASGFGDFLPSLAWKEIPSTSALSLRCKPFQERDAGVDRAPRIVLLDTKAGAPNSDRLHRDSPLVRDSLGALHLQGADKITAEDACIA